MDEAVAWLREQIETGLVAARALCDGQWGDRAWAVTECSDEEAGDCPCIVYQGEYKPLDQAQVPPIQYIADAEAPELAAWIAANDPQSAVARCEAELAILDEHALAALGEVGEGYRCRVCVTARESYPDDWYPDPWPCRTMRLLASGYRHRPGYAGHWGEKATTS